MGYRSDVAYIIKFKDVEQRDAFVTLMLAKNNETINNAIAETSHDRTDEPVITFKIDDVKWYPSFDDVRVHHELMDTAQDLYGALWRFVALGEDGATDERYYDPEDEIYDDLGVVHQLRASF